MKILELVADYPTLDGGQALQYAHTRNLYYMKHGINVVVLNFSCTKSYEIDGIKVIPYKEYESDTYKIVISHAANIRNHYRFLKKHAADFNKLVFFFHGHEVLKISKVYSKPYDFNKTGKIKTWIQNIYDDYKLGIWKKYYSKIAYKSEFIFVSQWMFNEFKKWVGLNENQLNNNIHIIYNCIGQFFENNQYNRGSEKKYDFVTIRNNIDGSKYSTDIICTLAKNHPQYKFLLVGEGIYFNFNQKPDNLEWQNRKLSHSQIVELLNASRCALMPTRTDAQGVMACEMATYGIPVITSDIPVCREVFQGFNQVSFINNNNCNKGFVSRYEDLLKEEYIRNEKYCSSNTVQREVDLLEMNE